MLAMRAIWQECISWTGQGIPSTQPCATKLRHTENTGQSGTSECSTIWRSWSTGLTLAGSALLASQPEALRDLALTLNGIGLGAGVFMYLALLALAFHRFYVHKRLPPTMAPTFWINLAPVGVIVVSALNLVAAAPFAGDKAPYLIAIFLLWGFGAFWLVLSALFTWSVRKIAPLPFSLTWWAFTFPLGAFTLGSQRISEVTGLATPLAFGWLAWALLAAIWSLTLAKTIAGVASGKLFQPHP